LGHGRGVMGRGVMVRGVMGRGVLMCGIHGWESESQGRGLGAARRFIDSGA
jgi:hypothetical protein